MGFLDAAKGAVKVLKYFPGCTTVRDGHTVLNYGAAYTAFMAKSIATQHNMRVNGLRNLHPGPGLVIAKHTSEKDIPDISVAIYRATGQMPYFVARDSLRRDGTGELDQWAEAQYTQLGAIFIDRDNPSPRSIKDILEKIHQDNIVVVFPEGTRKYGSHIGPFSPGAAMLAIDTWDRYGIDSAVYCVGIRRPVNAGKGVEINIAKPMSSRKDFYDGSKGRKKKARAEQMTAEMREMVNVLCSAEGKSVCTGETDRPAGRKFSRLENAVISTALSDSSARGFLGI